MFNRETYIARRSALKQGVGSGLILLLGNDESGANFKDNCYPFRQDSTFLYFFGLPYAGLAAIIDLDNDQEVVFGDELTIDDIIWMGVQPTLQENCERVGITDILPAAALAERLKRAEESGQTIHYLPSYRNEHQLKLWRLLGILPNSEKPSIPLIKEVVDLRNHKSAEEVDEIIRACNVTSEMHLEGIRSVRAGIPEYEVVAAIEAVAHAHNCRTSFSTIGTVNGQTLHNHYHGNMIGEGDLFLLDAGAETAMGYAGDMSSTIPAAKSFTQRQREVYDIQVAAHEASVAALRPGIRFETIYDLSAQTIVEGLKGLGLMKGDAAEAVRAGAHALFYPHGLGHMMGLDVHDMENLGEVYVGYAGEPKSTQFGRRSLRLGRILEPGFVLTIEPGVYFIPELIDLWKSEKRYADFINYEKVVTYKDFGGVRNEEDYLITETGAQRLGKKIPLTTEEVEAIRS